MLPEARLKALRDRLRSIPGTDDRPSPAEIRAARFSE
jgi:hypothetical protein